MMGEMGTCCGNSGGHGKDEVVGLIAIGKLIAHIVGL